MGRRSAGGREGEAMLSTGRRSERWGGRRTARRHDMALPHLPTLGEGEFPVEDDFALAIAVGRRRDRDRRREGLTATERLSGAIARGLVA